MVQPITDPSLSCHCGPISCQNWMKLISWETCSPPAQSSRLPAFPCPSMRFLPIMCSIPSQFCSYLTWWHPIQTQPEDQALSVLANSRVLFTCCVVGFLCFVRNKNLKKQNSPTPTLWDLALPPCDVSIVNLAGSGVTWDPSLRHFYEALS